MKYSHKEKQHQRVSGRPASGQFVQFEPSDRFRSRQNASYTPAFAASILEEANDGDPEQLAVAAREIQERNWDVILAMQVRRSSLLSLRWSVEPGGKEENALRAAEAFSEELSACGAFGRTGTFHDLLAHLMDAVIAPYAAAEIIWSPGGGLAGFRPVGAWNFTFRGSGEPKLVTTDHPDGMPLPDNKFILHSSSRSIDPVRGGLIRTLLWLHVFQNYPVKDLLSFVERYGMPFVVAKVDRGVWENEREALHELIRGFGPGGGGIFTKSTELELLQSANQSGEVYFKLLEYTGQAITKVILGQLASSSESSGLSGGTAQTQVRHDLLEADARAIESTIMAQLAVPWTSFNFPSGTPVPKLVFHTDPPADRIALATAVETLARAGYETDPDEMTAKFGFTLRKKAPEA